MTIDNSDPSSSDPWECYTQGCLETKLQNNPYYPFATREEYKYLQFGINNKGMKTFNDTVQREEYTTLCVICFNNRDGMQKLMACMPDDEALGKFKLHVLKDMRWNVNYQCLIKYWSGNIIRSMRWLRRQQEYAEHLNSHHLGLLEQ